MESSNSNGLLPPIKHEHPGQISEGQLPESPTVMLSITA